MINNKFYCLVACLTQIRFKYLSWVDYCQDPVKEVNMTNSL